MTRCLLVFAFATSLLAAPVPKADGLKPEQFTERRIQLLRDSRVQKELGLSAEQRIAVIDHFEASDEAYPSDMPSGPPVFFQEQVDRRRLELAEHVAKQTAMTQKMLAATITPVQLARVMELERRYLGPFAFADAEVAAELKLSRVQTAAVAKAIEGFRKVYDEGYGPRVKPSGQPIHDAAQPTTEAVLKLLSAEQGARWKAMLGATPKLAPLRFAASQGPIRAAAAKAFKTEGDASDR